MKLIPRQDQTSTDSGPGSYEPLRTLQWIRENVLAGLVDADVSDLWLQTNLPHVRLNRLTRLYYESEVRAWLREKARVRSEGYRRSKYPR